MNSWSQQLNVMDFGTLRYGRSRSRSWNKIRKVLILTGGSSSESLVAFAFLEDHAPRFNYGPCRSIIQFVSATPKITNHDIFDQLVIELQRGQFLGDLCKHCQSKRT